MASKTIKIQISHFSSEAKNYQPIIDKLIQEGWKFDGNLCTSEMVGKFTVIKKTGKAKLFEEDEFQHCWLKRTFKINSKK